MIKLYLDWNVISQMKNGNQDQLKNIVLDNDRFLIPFSTSHIDDIWSSYRETVEQKMLIDSDLAFITLLTKGICLFNRENDVILDSYQPQELFQQRIDEKGLFDDLSLEGLAKLFTEDDSTKSFGSIFIDLLKSIPIQETLQRAFQDSDSAMQIESLFPGLKDNLTLEGFFQSFSEMNKGLNDGERYKDLRRIVQSGLGINRDKIFDNQFPQEIIQSKYEELGQNRYQHDSNGKYAPRWFDEISNEYVSLDMHGYQEDKVNVHKGRKETFRNTREDAFHAAFASTCNFYILNDKKSYKKTKQVYTKFGINTIVLKPEEFIEYYKQYLDYKDSQIDLLLPFKILQHGEFVEEQLEGAILRTYYFPFFIFDFFTKMRMLITENDEETILLLSRDKPTNGNTYVMEIARLVKNISAIVGKDVQNIGEIKEEEFQMDNWVGRSWEFGNILFQLMNPNGHFQLYMNLKG